MTNPNPTKRRRYHLSPGRLIFGLFAVEGFLFLSEWFQWFAFNEKKGWTVLIAVAAVCLVVVVMLVWLVVSLLFRWRFQFGVRSLVVLVVAVAVPCSWLTVKLREAERQRKAVEAIGKAGWAVMYEYQLDETGVVILEREGEPPLPAWLPLGEDLFFDVLAVVGYDFTEVGDIALENVKGLKKLKGLSLSDTQITDTGLVHLDGLTDLTSLELADTEITDAGLVHLKRLKKLRVLSLYRAPVTDAGLKHLKGLPNLELLELSGTQVSDAGLENLKELTKLKRLYLSNTHVTAQGINKLQEALPNCEINWDAKTNPQQTKDP